MESSSPLRCKLSSPTDSVFMASCPAAPLIEPNFQVDDLLDFPNDDADDEESVLISGPLIQHATPAAGGLLFAPSLPATSIPMNKEEAARHEELSHGLCVPPDELVHQLEWLSSFNEDNFFAGGDAKLLSSTTTSSRASAGLARCKDAPIMAHRARDDFRSESPVSVLEHGGHAYALNHHVHRANRIRKARTGGRVWSLDILKPILFENRLKASYENSSLLVTSYSSAYSEPLCSFLQADESERPYKRMKQAAAHVDAATDSGLVRKCTHCSVQKTPQWRAGPMGPKTLCNACGVRYKSGRLVPEYRPAASPSFVNDIHSNSHRRILEMRRVKEVDSSIKLYKSKAERLYRRDSTKRDPYIVPRTLDEHACKETQSSKESSLCAEVSACEEAEGSRGGGVTNEGVSGKEDSSDGSTISIEATIASNEAHLHKASSPTIAYKDEHTMQENACASKMIAAFEGKSPCSGKDASVGDMFGLDKGQGHKGEPRVQNGEEENAVYVAK